MESTPTIDRLYYERDFIAQGYEIVAGVDEAGRGALAGPVAAGAVVLPTDAPTRLAAVDDSKKLTPAQRDILYDLICEAALTWAVGMASAAEIDSLGIAPATRLAMQRAIDALDPTPQALVVDWVRLKAINLPQVALKKGESKSLSIAAASILAKVSRDRYMIEQAERDYPGFGFAQHKGYGTAAHRAKIEATGGCDIHRKSFDPLRSRLRGL